MSVPFDVIFCPGALIEKLKEGFEEKLEEEEEKMEAAVAKGEIFALRNLCFGKYLLWKIFALENI